MKRYFENFILVFLLAFFIASCYKIINRFDETSQSNNVVKYLETIIEDNKTSITAEAETDSFFINTVEPIDLNEVRMIRLSSFPDFRSINNDFIGWIEIEGTKVNYPVVQSKDGTGYIKKDFYGKKSSDGSIYMAPQCDPSSFSNLVLYGHHMKDGTMFASINKYQDAGYYNEHPIIHLTQNMGFMIMRLLGRLGLMQLTQRI